MQKQIFALLVVFAGHALGGDLKKGDILTVKAGSLWFQTAGGLLVYQRFGTEISPGGFGKIPRSCTPMPGSLGIHCGSEGQGSFLQ